MCAPWPGVVQACFETWADHDRLGLLPPCGLFTFLSVGVRRESGRSPRSCLTCRISSRLRVRPGFGNRATFFRLCTNRRSADRMAPKGRTGRERTERDPDTPRLRARRLHTRARRQNAPNRVQSVPGCIPENPNRRKHE